MRWLGDWEHTTKEARFGPRPTGMEKLAEQIESWRGSGERKVWVCVGEQGCQCGRRDVGVRAEQETL